MTTAKYVLNGRLKSAEEITTESDIANIRRHGFYGKHPELGDYSVYLGGSDGGFIVVSKDDPNLIGVIKETDDMER